MKPSRLFMRLFLIGASSAVLAGLAAKPALAGPADHSPSIFDFGNDLPAPTTPAVRPAKRSAVGPEPSATKPPASPSPATVAKTPAPAMPAAPARLRLPTKAEQAAAERLIHEAYGKQYADPAPAVKAALAADLLRQADDPANSPAAQFVLLRDAADVSARVGDVKTAMSAITAAARRYQLEPPQELKVRASALAFAARAATEAEVLKEIAQQALSLSQSALRLEQFDTAERLVSSAGVAAAKSKDGVLIRSAQEQSRELNTAQAAFGAARIAAQILAKDPADPAANLTVGRYLCLVLGDWEGGLPLLAKGRDLTLKALAARDLAQPGSATAVEVGDGWWDFAEKQQGGGKSECQARAAYWYQAALPTLSGLLKTRVEARLEVAGSSLGGQSFQAIDELTGHGHVVDNAGNAKGTGIFALGLEPLPDKPDKPDEDIEANPGKSATPALAGNAAAARPSTREQLPPELRGVFDACHVDAQGVLTSDRRVNLGLGGTEGKHCILTGDLYLAPEPTESHNGGVAFHLRVLSLKVRVDLSINFMCAKRILREAGVVKTFAYPMKFEGIEREKWHHFKIDAGADTIAVQFDNHKGIAKGLIEAGGKNYIALAPGAKLRGLKVQIVP